MFRALCGTHASHPARLRPEIETPPLKRSKSNPPTTPTSQRISSDQSGSAPISPPSSGGAKLCNGVHNEDLEEFMQYKYGFSVLDDEGYPWGEKLPGWTTYRARHCAGVATGKKERCHECDRLYHAMANAKTRHNNSARDGTQKFIPTSVLKVSPYVRDLIEQFKKENKPNQKKKKTKMTSKLRSVVLFLHSKYMM